MHQTAESAEQLFNWALYRVWRCVLQLCAESIFVQADFGGVAEVIIMVARTAQRFLASTKASVSPS
jgi:hypothetical protein